MRLITRSPYPSKPLFTTLLLRPPSVSNFFLYLFQHRRSRMAPTPILLSPSRALASGISIAKHESAFRENSATIVMPSKEAAFLNPVQEFNRDISIMAIRTWSERVDNEKRARWELAIKKKEAKGKRKAAPPTTQVGREKRARTQAAEQDEHPHSAQAPQIAKRDESDDVGQTAEPQQDLQAISSEYRPYKFTLLEALSATGLRSIRYAKEIPLLKWVLANDLSPTAVQAMRRNVALNFPPDRPIEEWTAEEDTKQDAVRLEEENSILKDGQLDEDALMELENQAKAKKQTVPADKGAELSGEGEPSAGAEDGAEKAGKKSSGKENLIHPECKVQLNAGDAISLMYAHRDPSKRFDVVDLDPYGTAAPFLDGAVQSVADGGLLCVTCTDLAILAGHNYPEKCFSLYGGTGLKGEYSHEVALRLVLHSIATSAARYGRYIQPLLSLSIDFYLRVFVRVWTGPAEVKNNASKTGNVYWCVKCSNWHAQRMGRATKLESVGKGGKTNTYYKYQSAQGPPVGPKCDECEGTMHVAGPMWLGPLHEPDFCEELVANLDRNPKQVGTSARIKGMVSTAADELEDLFYFTPPKVSGIFHCVSPALDTTIAGLLHAGYQVSRSHCSPGSIKTSASRGQVYDMMRAWIEKNPVRVEKLKEGDAARQLLSKKAQREYDFEEKIAEAKEVMGGRLVRYQANPQANWGPGTAAKGHKGSKKRRIRPDDATAFIAAAESLSKTETTTDVDGVPCQDSDAQSQ